MARGVQSVTCLICNTEQPRVATENITLGGIDFPYGVLGCGHPTGLQADPGQALKAFMNVLRSSLRSSREESAA